MADYLEMLVNGLSQYIGVIIGGLIAFFSAVFADYFRSRREEKGVVDSNIKKMYLDESIVPVRNELAYYGNITLKIVNEIRRDFHFFKSVNDLKEYIKDIKSRSRVQKIIGYEFSHGRLTYLYKFGDKIPWAIQYAFWWYSGFLGDLLDEKRMQEFLVEGKSKELTETLTYVAQLVQSLRIWLEKKLLKLESLLRERKYRNFKEFEKIVLSEEVLKIASELGGLHEVYINEEKRRDKGEKWGQEIIDYINKHP